MHKFELRHCLLVLAGVASVNYARAESQLFVTTVSPQTTASTAASRVEVVAVPPGWPFQAGIRDSISVPVKHPINRRTAPQTAGDPRVRIVSPAAGQQFAPGQTVSITVELTPPLTANDIAVRVPNLGRLQGTNYSGSQYSATLVIPDFYAGPLTLIPAITDSLNTPIRGAEVTVAVRPETAPASIDLPRDYYVMSSPPPSTETISVLGNYPPDLRRDLSSAAAGTTFESSNPDVLKVDADGNVTTVARGIVIVTVENTGVKSRVIFVVEDPANPLPPKLVSGLRISKSTPVLDTQSGFYNQNLQVSYPGGIGGSSPPPIVGPLFVVLTGLPSNVTLINGRETKTLSPVGSPYVEIETPDGLTLEPGQAITIPLQFLNPSGRKIVYTTSIYRTLAEP